MTSTEHYDAVVIGAGQHVGASRTPRGAVGRLIGDVAGNHEHRHPGLADDAVHRYPQQPWHRG